MEEQKIIDAQKIVYSYPAEEGEESEQTLKGVTLSVNEGEFVAILGHNGSGKSTFAKQINVLLRAQSGSLFVAGYDAFDENNTWDIRKNAGMVFQNPDNQIVSTIVEEDVAFGPENLGVPQKELRERVDSALAAVNMSGMNERAPHMLSGGQKQRIAIAGVLAMHPRIIIFDEATAMLDPVGREEVMKTVEYLNKVQKKTIVMITHYMEEAANADRIFVMADGKVAKEGTPKQIFTDRSLLKKAGLIPPLSTSVYHDLFDLGIALEDCPVTASELVDLLCRYKSIN